MNVIFYLNHVLSNLHPLTLDQIPYAPESFLLNLFENWNIESHFINHCLSHLHLDISLTKLKLILHTPKSLKWLIKTVLEYLSRT